MILESKGSRQFEEIYQSMVNDVKVIDELAEA